MVNRGIRIGRSMLQAALSLTDVQTQGEFAAFACYTFMKYFEYLQ